MKIPMLADPTHKIGRDYGCLIEGDDEAAGVCMRATYIIDCEGKLRHMQMNDLPVGRNVNEILRLVEAFQYTDEYGEVCPSQWKQKGDPTMEADDESAKTQKYFNEAGAEESK